MRKILAAFYIFAAATTASYAGDRQEGCGSGSSSSEVVDVACGAASGVTATNLDIGGASLALGMLIALGIALHERSRHK